MAGKDKTYDYDDDYDEGVDIPDETGCNDTEKRYTELRRDDDDYYESLRGPEGSEHSDEGYFEEDGGIDGRATSMKKANNRISDNWRTQNIRDTDIENEYNSFSSSSISSPSSDYSLGASESSNDDNINRKRITIKDIPARRAALEARRERERLAQWEHRGKTKIVPRNSIRESDLGFAKYTRKTTPVRKAPVLPPDEDSEWNEEWITDHRVSLKGLRIKAWDSMGRRTRPPGPRQF